jgi:ectoine hydroxylase-related dioxygenase (phytanoyl-CoA dioxygenase family)
MARVIFGPHDIELPSEALGELRDSTALLANADSLRDRLAEDGYLLLRGLHDRALVKEARRQILERLDATGALDRRFPLDEARIAEGRHSIFRGGKNELTSCPAYRELVRGSRTLDVFSMLRGGPAVAFDYEWLRVVGTGDRTGAHFDIVYMGRGTPNVLTMWTPLGDVSYAAGPLAICEGSHRAPGFARLRQTYGKMDVDRDRVAGWFSEDPLEIRERFGGSWKTTEFCAGDALIFGMFTLHASLTNTTPCFRLGSDTRYQLASEPIDERWVGKDPKGHYAWHTGPEIPMAQKRAEWGV